MDKPYKPTGNALGAVLFNLVGLMLEHVHTLELHLYPIINLGQINIRLAEHYKQISPFRHVGALNRIIEGTRYQTQSLQNHTPLRLY